MILKKVFIYNKSKIHFKIKLRMNENNESLKKVN